MKILLVSSVLNNSGGASKAALLHAELLKKYGNEVILFSFEQEENSNFDYSVSRNSLGDKESVSTLGLFEKIRLLAKLFHNSEAYSLLLRAVKEHKPDIIHLHRVRLFSPSIYWAIKRCNAKVYMTLHDHYLTCPTSTRTFGKDELCPLSLCNPIFALKKKCVGNSRVWTLIALLEFYYRRYVVRDIGIVNKYFLPSRFLMKWTEKSGISRDKLCYLPNFVPVESFATREEMKRSYVTYIGRLSQEKGIGTFLNAASLMPDVKFQIIGDGPLRESISCEIKKRNIKNLTLRGALYEEQLCAARNEALVLVVPSECNENAPLVALEAFSSGLPVLGSNLGGIPELIDDGINGYLLKPGDAQDLKDKLTLILGDAKKMESMGRCGLEKYHRYFTREVHASIMLREYSSGPTAACHK
jgi:glycosyltransferase involved in cell wall biosynthesis